MNFLIYKSYIQLLEHEVAVQYCVSVLRKLKNFVFQLRLHTHTQKHMTLID